ncbi:MAG: polysaccharide biosynthesis tyrosine autokinase [Sulfurovum sp.]|nr:polysaccharide biosynthesis tyrosine autokinase [Sulfurovum sp.]
MKQSEQKLNQTDIDLGELFKTLFHDKWSILLVSFFTLLIAAVFLYFKTPIYSSQAIIEVKPDAKQSMQAGDFLGSTFPTLGNEKVDKEIEILKTFHINNHALNKVNFQIQYFVDKGFKKVEIYDNVPIEVKNMTILDQHVAGTIIKLIPAKDGYLLQVENSFTKKLLHSLFNKKIIALDNEKIHTYGSSVKTNYFELTIEKKSPIEQPIYFLIKGNNRQIYQTMSNNKDLQIIQINPNAPLIRVTYQDTILERADIYVNALIESFILQSVAEKSKKTDRILDFIKKQLSDMKTKLDESEEKLEKYRIENQAINPTLQAETYIRELSNIEIELSRNRLKEKLIQNLILFTQKNKDLNAIAPSLMQLDDTPTLDLITRLQEAQIKEEGLKAEFSDKHPGLIAVRKQIRHINKKITLNIQNLESSMSDRNTNLENLKKSYEKNLESLPTQERTLINLKRDYEVSSETYNYLLKKKSENEMTKVAILSDYRIIDRASNDGEPIGPKRSFILLAALILGLILGILQALFRSFLNVKIQTKKDVESLTTLPIYGILPVLNQKVLKLEVFKDPRSPFSEAYRSLRTNLQFARKPNQANVVLVTSTISGEGKSTTVANLGAIFQMANIKTVVINLDLRKPTLHYYFNVKNNAGMSTYLSGKNTIEEIIQSTEFKNLDIITSGPIPPNPSELILTDRLDKLVDKLKESYDYIFIDSAPMGLVSDTMHLMQYADISLIVFRENYAKKSFVTDLNSLVQKHDLKNIGLVINSVDVSSGSYGYGYGYGYGNAGSNRNKINKNKINKLLDRFSY